MSELRDTNVNGDMNVTGSISAGVNLKEAIKYLYNSDKEKLTDGLYGVIRNGYATLFFENFCPSNIEIGILKTYYTLPDKYRPVTNVYTKLFLNSTVEVVENNEVVTMPYIEINYHGPLRINFRTNISLISTVCYPVLIQ